MRILITGISGFIGGHLGECLLADGAELHGLARSDFDPPWPKCAYHRADITDRDELASALRAARPDRIYHLGGLIRAPADRESDLFESNVLGTARLFEALRVLDMTPRVLVASSGAVYGVPNGLPIDEAAPLRPVSAYGASKVAQESVALQAHLAYGIPAVVTRTFNLLGSGQPVSLVASGLARQIAKAESGGERTIRVGNLAPRRDFLDVRDAVRAYVLLMEAGEPGRVYNVCSGTSRSVRDCADVLMGHARVPVELEIERLRVRDSAQEIEDHFGAPDRLKAETGWEPNIGFENSLADMLEHWRKVLKEKEVHELA